MGWRRRRIQVGARPSQRQLDRRPTIVLLAFVGRQRTALRARPFGLRLLKLDVLALETASHTQYSTVMHRPALQNAFHVAPGPLAHEISAQRPLAARAASAMWARDPSVWSTDAGDQQKIANRLGWLNSPGLMAASIDRLRGFAEAVKRDGFTDVVLLGMGGSSLAPEVLRAVVGESDGWPRLHMLDSTDPASVLSIASPPKHTLFLLASKSGTTIEPNSLAAHFRRALEQAGIARWADHFVAITDEGTQLAQRARDERFRDVFINPADIGGRYSALSFFGMVPSAVMGQDVEAIIGWGTAMLAEARTGAEDAENNAAVGLGLFMGAAARAGRDKLTLIVPPAFEPFGLWVEQLVAESTGKKGVGVIPIAGETLGPPGAYGADRAFVRLRLAGDPTEAARDAAVHELEAEAPVATIDVPDRASLGAEFVRWEIATAVAGALLGINPFDEPNVQQAKDATRTLLDRFKADGRLPVPAADRTVDGVTFTLSAAARDVLAGRPPDAILASLQPGDYIAVLAYLGPDPALFDALRTFRMRARDATKAATMLGYGPRYLHSTGQLHKGGPDTGVFVLITASPAADVDIPGEPFSFGTLELAQGLGDFTSLGAAGRRAVHVHLPSPDPGLLTQALDRIAPKHP